MEFNNYLKTTAQKIDEELDEILSTFLNNAKETNIKLLPLALGFLKSCKGGKRIRGVLARLGYELAGGAGEEIITIGAALEIIHAAILIHDDVIDQSLTRRSQLTLHQALGGGHYGQSQAIALGDIGLYLPIQIIANSKFLGEYKLKALARLSQIIVSTGWGEALDVELPHLDKESNEEDINLLYTLKTSYYTISGPLILGAILAGADEQLLINKLAEFGKNLGIAYQIQDDILGIFGLENTTGKSIKSDILEGKNTLLYIHALAFSNPAQKIALKKYYGNPKANNKQVKIIRQIFEDTKALEYAQAKALEYTQRAKSIIPQITSSHKMNKLFEGLIDYLVSRTS